MVSVLRPFGEVVAKPFSVGHTGSELKDLADYLKSLDGETRVVMEHTGRYYEPVARFLHEEGISCFDFWWLSCYTNADHALQDVRKWNGITAAIWPVSSSI